MPYIAMICSTCGEHSERYHNVKTCPKCGTIALIAVNPYEHQSMVSLRMENAALRNEVNALRNQLGIGRKYVDWTNLKANAAGIAAKQNNQPCDAP